MNIHLDKTQATTKVSRRTVLAGLGGLSFGLALGSDGLKARRRSRSQHRRRQGVQRLGADRARRQGDDPDRRRRNGPGLHDRTADDRGGGNGRRLVEGCARMGAGRCQGLRLLVQQQHQDDGDRRQPRDDALLQRPPRRRRAGAQGAAGERRREVGRRRGNAAHRAGIRRQSGERPEARLWRDRGVRQNPLAASRGRRQGAEAEERLAHDRQGRGAPRHTREGQRLGRLRDGRARSRNGLRHDAPFAGAQSPRRRAGTTPISQRCRG